MRESTPSPTSLTKALTIGACLLAAPLPWVHAEFLYAPGANATPNGFYEPTLDYENLYYEYSAWDIFYAPHTEGNYPDIFAPWGGVSDGNGGWAPEPKPANFPNSGAYNPSIPFAFWDTRNPTIKQTGTNSTFIIGPDITGNIYSFQSKTSYMLSDNVADSTPSANFAELGSVIFQFQTDGTNVDFGTLRLVWSDGNTTHTIYATEAEYLREYRSASAGGSTHWSAGAGYGNRVAVQWDLTGLVDLQGNPVRSYQILWDSESSSMSFQKADLVTMEYYDAGIPHAAIWKGASGNWNQSSNWGFSDNSGLSLPAANGNLRFQNTGAAVLTLDDGNHTVGELIFENPGNVSINSIAGQTYRLTTNTGVTTRSTATGTYTINTGVVLGALNFFEINAGTVVMNGQVSGTYGLAKTGQGTLHLAGNNAFTGFLALQEGTLRISGANTYTGATTLLNGRMIVQANAGTTGALGSSTSDIAVGADASLFQYVSEGSALQAELFIDGNWTISRGISLAAGDFTKRLGVVNATSAGATFSGNISLTSATADPGNPDASAGKVYLTAQNAGDVMNVTAQMTGGSATKTVTIDGQGTVIYSGANKTYANATSVDHGRLVIAQGTAHTGNGTYTVKSGAYLQIDGTLGGSGLLNMEGGTLGGKGTVQRAVTFNLGDTVAPGNSTGTLTFTQNVTFGAGGNYLLEIQNATGAAGIGWDMIDIQGRLDITATSSDRFVIDLNTLNGSSQAGQAANFLAGGLYDWTILTATAGITGFSASAFTIDLGDFANANSGYFSITRLLNGNGSESLVLHYSAVPEPGRALLMLGGMLALALRRRRHPSPQR
ncbi:MAG: autotransporter-associated beta strand repeat-containing protein [Verrucomicrobium sp.]